jgi:hypothetical protein
MIRVYVELILDVDCDAGAADGANEILRDQQRDCVPTSCLLDYALVSFEPLEIEGLTAENYEEGDAFNTEEN